MNNELKAITMDNRDERAHLATTTEQVDTLAWFSGDLDPVVLLAMVRNPLFNRHMFTRSPLATLVNKKLKKEIQEVWVWSEIMEALLGSKVVTLEEKESLIKLLKEERDILPPKDTYCSIPWNHLGIMTNGDIRMCCQMIYPPFGRTKVNVKDVKNIDDVRNLPILKQVRKSMLEGKKHSLCKLCWDEEKFGGRSKRTHQNKIYSKLTPLIIDATKKNGEVDVKKIPLNYYDLRLGNKCNLKCRSCGPTESDLWLEDVKALGDSTKPLSYYGYKDYELKEVDGLMTIDSTDFDWPQATNFLEQILDNKQNVDRLYFTGGEPSVNIPHIQFLQKLVKENVAKNIYLEYNSNGISLPDRLLNLWNNFDGVGIGFSIDATEERYEYLRFPGRWYKFLNTIKKIDKFITTDSMSNFSASLAPTTSVYNLIHMIELNKFVWTTPKWFSNFIPMHVLEHPDYMNPKIFPIEAKKKISEVYQQFFETVEDDYLDKITDKDAKKYSIDSVNVLRHLLDYIQEEVPNQREMLIDFYEKTEIMDKIRKQNWETTFPELSILNIPEFRKTNFTQGPYSDPGN